MGAKKEIENGTTLFKASIYNDPEKKRIPKIKNLKTIFTF